jgi:hypothetical protein
MKAMNTNAAAATCPRKKIQVVTLRVNENDFNIIKRSIPEKSPFSFFSIRRIN